MGLIAEYSRRKDLNVPPLVLEHYKGKRIVSLKSAGLALMVFLLGVEVGFFGHKYFLEHRELPVKIEEIPKPLYELTKERSIWT